MARISKNAYEQDVAAAKAVIQTADAVLSSARRAGLMKNGRENTGAGGAEGTNALAAMPRCTRLTKLGLPCKAAAPDSLGGITCVMHATAEELTSAGITINRRQPRIYTALEALIDDQAMRIAGVYAEALEAYDKDGNVDHGTRLKAAEALMSRPYGLPSSKTEISGPDDSALQIQHLLANSPSQATDTE